MTIFELWDSVQSYGAGFIFLLGVVLFYTGRLVNGDVARKARLDAIAEMDKAQTEQMALMNQRFEEMQTIWRERFKEAADERNYYRSIALTFAKQAEQGIQLAQEKLPNL